MAKLEMQVTDHELRFWQDEQDSPVSKEQEITEGITTNMGMKFDKDGALIRMTRPQIQKCLMNAYDKVFKFKDEIGGLEESVESAHDKIKAFKNDIRKSKADNQILLR